jgi:hypothetical protein
MNSDSGVVTNRCGGFLGEPHPFELGPDAGQRFGQVLLDVVAERFER